jgi:hypothetical protein
MRRVAEPGTFFDRMRSSPTMLAFALVLKTSASNTSAKVLSNPAFPWRESKYSYGQPGF